MGRRNSWSISVRCVCLCDERGKWHTLDDNDDVRMGGWSLRHRMKAMSKDDAHQTNIEGGYTSILSAVENDKAKVALRKMMGLEEKTNLLWL